MKQNKSTFLLTTISGIIACSVSVYAGVVIEYPGMDALMRDSDAIVVVTAPKPVPVEKGTTAKPGKSGPPKISGLPDYQSGARSVVLVQKTLKGTLEEGTTVSVYLPADDRSFGIQGVSQDSNFFRDASAVAAKPDLGVPVKRDSLKVVLAPGEQEAWDNKFPFPPHSVGSIYGPKVHGESELLFLRVTNNTPALETFPCVGSHVKVDEAQLDRDLSGLSIRQAVEVLIEK